MALTATMAAVLDTIVKQSPTQKSYDEIAEQSAVCRRSAIRAIRNLEKIGLVNIIERRKDRPHTIEATPSAYILRNLGKRN